MAKKREGGVSTIAWYSFLGVALGVATLIVVQAVMVGFKEEFTDRIIGANPHLVIQKSLFTEENKINNEIKDTLINKITKIQNIVHAYPVISGQVMGAFEGKYSGLQVVGIYKEDLKKIDLIANPEKKIGDIDNFYGGISVGKGVANSLGIGIDQNLRLISPDGLKTLFGTTPRIGDFPVKYVFKVGRYDIDRYRIYMPLFDAQMFFNKENQIDKINVLVKDPNKVNEIQENLANSLGNDYDIWTWKDYSGAFLNALDVERRVMFIILSLVILIAALNIISGLVMLVKNKSKDIGILRTMGLSQNSIVRVFIICGSLIGILGTISGLILGTTFSYFLPDLQIFIEETLNRELWNPELRFLTEVPVRLRLLDLFYICFISLALSVVVTIFPAINAARLDPVEALRHE
ncbi:MAG: lipoprotein-releasing ABC transporter permease subunit [Pseudomonadota bacterium]|nr:lipoprotein-releasing ABC transporter permease subunit [Pseudomonadota bacterium]